MTPKTRLVPSAALAAALLATAAPAPAVTPDWGVKLRAGGLSEEARDLGLGEDADAAEHTEGFLDLQPQLHTTFSPVFSNFIRAQAFLPSGMVYQNEADETVEVETYGALREFWFDYGGITDYPGEVLRLGLQRLREPDGLWWDRDIESARWIFDTTLFQFQLGAGKQYGLYRTDDVELAESQRDRAYGFMGIGTQWLPDNFVGARVAYAVDQRGLPGEGTELEPGPVDPVTGEPTYSEPTVRRHGWVGVYLDNRFYHWEHEPGLTYRVELIGMGGSTERATLGEGSGTVDGTASEDIRALGGEAALRARFSETFPVMVGAAYAYGQGGRDNGKSNDFRQTGLHSNRSRFTGTRTYINRFNEALQADLTNLRVATAFVSFQLPNWDFSVVGSQFQRDDTSRTISADGIDARPDPASTSADIGMGWDVVLSRFFARGSGKLYSPEDDLRTNVRLRASRFEPGEAFGTQDMKDPVRLLLEGTLWF